MLDSCSCRRPRSRCWSRGYVVEGPRMSLVWGRDWSRLRRRWRSPWKRGRMIGSSWTMTWRGRTRRWKSGWLMKGDMGARPDWSCNRQGNRETGSEHDPQCPKDDDAEIPWDTWFLTFGTCVPIDQWTVADMEMLHAAHSQIRPYEMMKQYRIRNRRRYCNQSHQTTARRNALQPPEWDV